MTDPANFFPLPAMPDCPALIAVQEQMAADAASMTPLTPLVRVDTLPVHEFDDMLVPVQPPADPVAAAKPTPPSPLPQLAKRKPAPVNMDAKRKRVAQPAAAAPRDISIAQLADYQEEASYAAILKLREFCRQNDVDLQGPRVVRIQRWLARELPVHISMAAAPKVLDLTHDE